MNRHKLFTLLLSIAFLFCFLFCSHLDASMHKFELKELVNESQMIVIGEIIETKLITYNPLDIYTKLTLKVEENIFSREKQISVGGNLVFVTPDKIETPGMWTSTVVAKFSIGETVLVFLRRDPIQLKLQGGPQGKYTIEEYNPSEESHAIDYGGGVQEL